MVNEIIKISVRNLIEFILRSGDIDSEYRGANRAVLGTKAHQKLQKANEQSFDDYRKEVYLKCELSYGKLNLIIDGRADGIFREGDFYIVEEIKSTNSKLDLIDENYNELHLAQVKFYAYMYCIENNIRDIKIQLSYFQLSTEEVKSFRREYNLEELQEFVMYVVKQYEKWASYKSDWVDKRNESIKVLEFPYKSYRHRQRDLAVAVYNTIKNEGIIYAEAPTGIGKTISTTFPAIKSIGEGLTDCIFYLTSKTITRTVAEEAFIKMKANGLKIKSISLTAKDKICFNNEKSCNAEECEYAKGYYDRINDVVYEMIKKEDTFSREVIEQYAQMYRVCPFELSLDISLFCDAVICDYNYAFDPRVNLKRFFQETVKENYVFLVDESHNLVDRAREMYSSSLSKNKILKVRGIVKAKSKLLYKYLNSINRFFNDYKGEVQGTGGNSLIIKESPTDIIPLLRNFLREADEYLVKNKGTEDYDCILELYFDINNFINIFEIYDEGYYTYFTFENGDFIVKLFCIEPRNQLEKLYKNARAIAMFSATLTPKNYYMDMLGRKETLYSLTLQSPFPQENLSVSLAPIATKFVLRDKTKSIIKEYIYEFIKNRKGNYMVFFPSYAYMKSIYDGFRGEYVDIDIIIQKESMNEDEREEFLKEFDENNVNTKIAFCVMGGVFSEGIDLIREKLIGAIIVGVALPQICLERDLIKKYYDDKDLSGYDYSYTYPGMTKVLQAAGRVIRTMEDKGAILLIDNRFYTKKYFNIMPQNWNHIKLIKNKEHLNIVLKEFWKNV
ncbi:DNA excision repair protein ERCC-2 [Clostridium cavendishii DSM 21758]|uniref:DNA excision repair protein ERCC-2 n=1 Tax=Clostridium cavendishii DSM 21758 TaxID=1121302 RepID=A0A1M6TST1_9CLOT|nr:helicase C-terminal domain-containing protein [Clostridium cavendishii]SHK59878.1 DNA excision repair protein ERCC-2 [Clostridium cavendishii DSM 21758]